ncbi:eukaryotic translation initiation factor 1A, Y-chromosomal-like isoform X2 [Piliocolobus tephrosceles]|uniref:eukaryotic translation initiation factor 1A, Y-chromosomal-like isoform X2 n=1 Tax=Piliocolobus tephrosceles TaxID=591936 RepID=UPI000C29BC21|nr:eukaryotic translation initiation factor 1A, Y-chromosomal-like isoform X2 [Piliocolobus tephrosceles]
MPKNKGKGGKNRRRGKNENESEKRELVFKDDGQEYAQVIKMLGNGRLEALCFDGVKRLCHIRGKLRKKVWINTSDIILVGLRDYQAWASAIEHSVLIHLKANGVSGIPRGISDIVVPKCRSEK